MFAFELHDATRCREGIVHMLESHVDYHVLTASKAGYCSVMWLPCR